MAIKDRIKELTKRAGNTAAEHKDQINEAVEKAEVAADQRTGGKYHDQLANAAAKAEAYVEKLQPQEPGAETPPDATRPPEKPAN
jgi:ElaB/YqjD/DUF883 family membrane-anchored ribosome-binding protein